MYLEPKETARLYKLLSDKLGNDTTEAMFKYIDNKTERTVEATIKTLATKDDLREIRNEMVEMKLATKDDFANVRKEIGEYKTETIKWMFIFWIGQVGATMALIFLFLKK